MRDRLLRIVATEHAGPHTIGIIDETSDPKKGDKTPGVQMQWCGRLGKAESRMVAVHLVFASGDFHCLVDGDLHLPESWDSERGRGYVDEMCHRGSLFATRVEQPWADPTASSIHCRQVRRRAWLERATDGAKRSTLLH